MPTYARHASGVIIMADVGNRQSIDGVVEWKKVVDEILILQPPTILMVNKVAL